jgi:hypothetical protein
MTNTLLFTAFRIQGFLYPQGALVMALYQIGARMLTRMLGVKS